MLAPPGPDPAYRQFHHRFGPTIRARLLQAWGTALSVAVLFVLAAVWTDFAPDTILKGLPRVGEYFGKLLSIEPSRGADPVPVLAFGHIFGGAKEPQSLAYWFYRIDVYAALLWQTLQMAVLATVLGFAAAFALCFPATGSLSRPWPMVFLIRRLLEILRTIPQVVLALILVWPFGIGPLAVILAMAIHTTGGLGKLFAELNENADPRPMEGIVSAGGSWLAQIRYGVVPQVLPGFLSYALLRFEINVRSSTILGFVGAGGIGMELKRTIGFNIYEEVSAICILILLTVVVLDLTSERIRHVFIGRMQ